MINNNRCTSSTLDVLVTYNKGLVPSVSMMGRYLFAYNVYDGIFYMKVVQDGSVRVISTNTANYPDSIRAIIDISEQPSTTGYLKKTAKNTWTLVAGVETSESDPVFTASSWYNTTNNSSNWNTAYGWGNHASAGYLTSFTESDPIFSSWVSTTFTSLEATLIKGSLTVGYIPYASSLSKNTLQNSYISQDTYSHVGINTASPQEALHVTGSIRQSGITSTMVKVDSDGKFVAASSGIDYSAPLGFTPEDVSNKKTSLTDNSDTYYPTQKAVKSALDGKSDVGHTHSYLTDLVNDTTPQLGGNLDLNGKCIDYGAILSTNGAYQGDIKTVTVDTNGVGFGALLAQGTDFHFDEADADAVANCYALVMALETGTGSKKVLLKGEICNTDWNWSAGFIYASTTQGTLTQTKPTGTDDVNVIVGWSLSADTMWFAPYSYYQEHV